MKISSLIRAAIASCALALTAQASGAALQVNSSGILTGAKGVTVQGKLYDVTFVDGTCAAIFTGCDAASDFTFKNLTDARAAVTALMAEVSIDGTAGSFDTIGGRIFGCSDTFLCGSIVPYNASSGSNVVLAAYTLNYFGNNNSSDTTSTNSYNRLENYANVPNFNFAKFQVAAAAVPEPSSIALMGLAFAGLAFSRRRKA